jgi:hypothetical protein
LPAIATDSELDRFVPVTVTSVPTGPEAGEKEVITGLWALDVKINPVRKNRIAAIVEKKKRMALEIKFELIL